GCRRLILIEAPSSADHRGMLIAGNYHSQRGGDLLCGGFCQALFIVFLVCRCPLPSQILQTSRCDLCSGRSNAEGISASTALPSVPPAGHRPPNPACAHGTWRAP